MPTGNILFIDDEAGLRAVVARVLEFEGHAVLQAPDARRGLEALQQHAADVLVVLCDVKLPDANGVELLPRLKAVAPQAEVILLTAYGAVPDGVQAMKLGAFDYLTKGDSDDQLVVVVARAMEKARLQRRAADLEKQAGAQHGFASMIGPSAALRHAKALAERVAPTEAAVLLEGPTGSGKELFAQATHRASPRRSKPFVAVNCSALPRELMESELFGYRRGAFTGAHADKKGLFEEASGGTLFLDEIGELDVNLQAKLLRVLENQEFTKLGDTRPTRVSARLVAATNRSLRQETDQGRFRPDLYYRLAGFVVAVPPLNARRDDIEPLATHFLRLYAARLRKRLTGMAPEFVQLLLRHDWRGNVRELKNVLERAVILADGETLTADTLPAEFRAPPAPPAGANGSGRSLRGVEKRQIGLVLQETAGNKAEAARQLGISVKTLYRKILEYAL